MSRLLWHLRSPDLIPAEHVVDSGRAVIVKATDKGEYLFIRYSISPVEFPRRRQSFMPFTIFTIFHLRVLFFYLYHRPVFGEILFFFVTALNIFDQISFYYSQP